MYKEVAVLLVGLGTWLAEHPHVIARQGLQAQLAARPWVANLLRHAYRVALTVYTTVHGRLPSSPADRVAQATWYPKSDASVTVLAGKLELCQEWLQHECAESVTWNDKSAPLFIEMYTNSLPDTASGGGKSGRNWEALGFQGQDPATDLRSTGQLGFEHLHSLFVDSRRGERLVRESGSSSSVTSQLPDQWYPPALVSIRLSGALYNVFKSYPQLLIRLFGTEDPCKTLQQELKAVHAPLMEEFHRQWLAAVDRRDIRTYFDNEAILKAFEHDLAQRLWTLDFMNAEQLSALSCQTSYF